MSLAENSNRDAEDFDKIKTKMRNQITEAFRKNSLFTNLFKKNLIKEYLGSPVKPCVYPKIIDSL